MIRAAAVLVFLAAPAAAQGLSGHALCQAVWARVAEVGSALGPVSGTVAPPEGDWCVVRAPRLDMPGLYMPDWAADEVRFRGGALVWALEGGPPPDRLDIAVEGFALLVQTGQPLMDYLYAAQARAFPIRAEAALAWDAARRELVIERVAADFPGDNRLTLSARVAKVDLSSAGAAQMALTGFAVTEADLTIRTHGWFESYVLLPLGAQVMTERPDMLAAEAAFKAEATALVDSLPDSAFDPASKSALRALVGELPNPSGTLTVALRSAAGVGPARLAPFALTGVPGSLAETAPLILDGVNFTIGWTHEDTP
jgi:hypothetical protein